jgi:hypothetical protein
VHKKRRKDQKESCIRKGGRIKRKNQKKRRKDQKEESKEKEEGSKGIGRFAAEHLRFPFS